MRIWVVENGLLDRTGHHFNNSVGLRDACARRGIETRFLVNRHAEPEVLGELDAEPAFDFGPYDHSSGDPLAGPIENLIVQGNAFAHSLSAFKAEIDPDDLVVVPSTLQNELYGCAQGLAQLSPARRPRLALTFLVENFFAPGTRSLGLVAALYRFAARQLGRVSDTGRILLGANGSEMAHSLSQVLAMPVEEFPIPKTYPPLSSQAAPRNRRPVVALLGHSRREKGFHLIPEIVRRLPGVDFIVQVAPESAESMWQDAAPAMRAAANVQLVPGALDTAAYHALMGRADIALLPYDPELMPFRSSGVFAEAVAAGKVVVVPSATWMAAWLANGRAAGVMFERFDAASIGAAVRDALARIGELSDDARLLAPAWRATQSAGGYLDRVLEHFSVGTEVV